MNVIGIDPGASGGLAYLWPSPTAHLPVEAIKMPATNGDIKAWIREHDDAVCYMENVGPMKGDGKASLATFMRHAGFLDGCLAMADIRVELVSPAVWQRALGAPKQRPVKRPGKKATPEELKAYRAAFQRAKTEKKNGHKELAQRLFPQVRKMTHAIADALLIAEYGRRTEAARG